MGFGHVYIRADQKDVLKQLDLILKQRGFDSFPITPETHPTQMKQIHEIDQKLFWIAPCLNQWTGLFEFRYYNNEFRERWGYTDEKLVAALSEGLGTAVYRIEVIDTRGFWMYWRLENGKEIDSDTYEDNPADRSADPGHPRYKLNRIIEKEGIKNISLGYENIPGSMVAPIENCHFWNDGIEGLEGFVHRAYKAGPEANRPLPPEDEERRTGN